MGSKYASIYIRTDDARKTILRILKMYDMNSRLENINPVIRNEYLAIVENAKKFGNTILNHLLRIDNDLTIVGTTTMVSIYDRNLSFETVSEKAREISREVIDPVFYLSCFDGDIFIFGIFVNGKQRTNGVVGEAVQDYGFSEKCANLKLLAKYWGFSIDKLEQLFNEVDDIVALISKLERGFEELIGLPLNFQRDCVSIYNGVYQKVYEDNGIDIYTKS